MTAQIELSGVNKHYGAYHALRDINLSIRKGSFTALVGPSGCGKSTLLRSLAGLESISTGELKIAGDLMNNVPPRKRDVAMVFQSYALYPHMSVRANIGFPLKMAGVAKAEIARKVEAAAATLNLTDYLERRPRELSGGQRQRVAIGRAIVREPNGFLFDEPLSNLDAALRVNMRLELSELHQQLGTTMIYVTHDQVEAMTMADKIVVLNKGRVEQVGSPLELYRKPANLFVAGFIGSPRMNFLKGEYASRNGAATVGVRPEHMTISTTGGDIRGTAGVAEHLGSDTFIHVRLDSGEQITARSIGEYRVAHGDPVWLTPEQNNLHRFDAEGRAAG